MTRATLRSFDGTESYGVELRRPDRYRILRQDLQHEGASIARGTGLSYCAASAGEDVRVLLSRGYDRLLAFDEATGIVEAESGVTLGKLYEFSVPRGWILPVMPGHPSITLGGCAAADVHGKNQHREGAFSGVVESLVLWHPDRGELVCSRAQNPEAFELTLGGFGLTGFIVSLRLRLQRIGSSSFVRERLPVKSLAEAAAVMRARADADSLYSWHQLNGGGPGRGFVYCARGVAGRGESRLSWAPLSAEKRGRRLPPLYNRLTTRLALGAYALSERLHPSKMTIGLGEAVFPVVGREFYFDLFGRRGFREYQALVPEPAFPEMAESIARLARESRAPITLASLKLFSGKASLLRFEADGVCFALDCPEGEPALRFFAGLDEVVARLGGIVNLAKDGRATAALARRLYPGYGDFKRRLAAFDPKRRFDSALRRRLDV